MQKVLVIGATGFIGGHIARSALDADFKVFGLRRDPNRTGQLEGVDINWISGNLEEKESLIEAMTGKDIVFHSGGFYPKDGNPRKIAVQVAYAKEEIMNVIQAAQITRIKRVIYTSSLTTIGHPDPTEDRLADENDYYQPGTLEKSGYYESKIAMERVFLDACANGLPGVVLNPTAVFGPGDVNLTMASLLIAVAHGWFIGWLPGNINVVDVRDVALGHIAAVDRGRVGERYIIGGNNYQIRELLSISAAAAGVNPPWFKIPLGVLKMLTFLGDVFPFLPVPTNHLRAVHLWQGYNTQKAEVEFGISPRDFKTTVLDSLGWLRHYGYLKEK
jgi:dihydroflavonol-4-reductase